MKVLMVGLGAIGQRHLRNLRAIIGTESDFFAYRVRKFSAVITPTLQLEVDRNVEQENGVRAFADLQKALAEKPEIAVICNPSSMHVPVALQCARAGCDLFIEKPLSSSLEGLPELLSTVESQRRIAMVGYQFRFHPCFQRLQEILQQGDLGNLLAVRATIGEYLPGWHRYEDYRKSYAARSELGGGVLLSQIHEFDYLYALFGKARRLYTIGGHLSNLEINVEDVASTLMECEVGGRPLPVHLHQDYLQRPPSKQCEVIGDAGRAVLDFPSLSVVLYNHVGEVASRFHLESFDRNQLFLSEMQHFLECVKTRSKPVVDLGEGIWSLKLALAARESLAIRQTVELSPEITGASKTKNDDAKSF
ncbi:MAG TPA: Gfo/Idh/MocA family oxidoreductase [Terriglobales bacterium]|nr:Gfo/Idh/MocA family oxidoreductase [Terriglobales bacterium]